MKRWRKSEFDKHQILQRTVKRLHKSGVSEAEVRLVLRHTYRVLRIWYLGKKYFQVSAWLSMKSLNFLIFNSTKKPRPPSNKS